ncbi:FKBP-type peptidyl-prolyl cis-trans isomerase [Actinoallomurus sp. CA-150999]|uniref:FKBP-type peptidyl-prolyl cis-trans isomerase n=1 Tax=Actinoallomurus sp. CA-150999 TaxID=3239887 RepID=UPI003D8F171E
MSNKIAPQAAAPWIEIEAGLLYRDLRKSDGEPIAVGDTVRVHYQVALGDIREGEPRWTDSSWERTVPFRFRIGAGEVLKGVDAAVVGMRVASERRIVLSPEWAYGERGLSDIIPGASTLTVQVYIVMKEDSEELGGSKE